MKRLLAAVLMVLGLLSLWAEDMTEDQLVKELAALEAKDDKAVKLVARGLKGPRADVLVRALEAVARLKIPGQDKIALTLAVKGDVWPVRRAATLALKETGPKDVAKKLAPYAATNLTEAAALEALGWLGTDEAVIELGTLSRKGKSNLTRSRAAHALGLTRNPKAVALLTELAASKEPMVKGWALRGLGEVGDKAAVPFLLADAQKQEEQAFRSRTGVALRRIGQTGDSPITLAQEPDPLCRQLEALSVARWRIKDEVYAPLLDHASDKVKSWAVFAAARADDDTFGMVLKAAELDSPDIWVQRNQALLLPKLKKEGQMKLLAHLMKSKHERVRMEALCHVARLGEDLTDPEAALLKEALKDPAWDVAVVAAFGAARRRMPDLPPLLEPLAAHSDWRFRAGAYYAMAFIMDPRILPLLGKGLDDSDVMVAKLCRRILSTVTGESFTLQKDFAAWRSGKGAAFAFGKDRKTLARYETREYEDEAYRVVGESEILIKVGEDTLDSVMAELGFKPQNITKVSLSEADFNPEQVLVVTCLATLTLEEVKRVDWFVTLGGSLFMTDEALGREGYQPVAGYAGIGSEVQLYDHTLHPAEMRDPDHPLLRDVFRKAGDPGNDLLAATRPERSHYGEWEQWGSFMIRIDDPFRAEVVADSLQMRESLNWSPLVTVWSHGLGRAMQSVTHFHYQMNLVKLDIDGGKKPDRFRKIVDELGFPLETARAWEAQGKLDAKTLPFLYGEFPLFHLMSNFIREQHTLLGRAGSKGASKEGRGR